MAEVAGNSLLLSKNDIFTSVEEAKNVVQRYTETNYVDFKVATNNAKALKYCCKYGTRLRRRGKGEREGQHYNALQCQATITFYKSQKDGSLKCTKLDNVHSHPVSEKIYNDENVVLEEEELNLCANLRAGNCKPNQIKRVLLEKFNKKITIQKLKNTLAKLPSEDDDVDFETFLDEFDNNGGDVDWTEDPDGTVRCMTFSSIKMKNAFASSNPPLVQLDTSFDIEKARYKLMAVVYLNPTTNRSEVAFMALLCDESKPNVQFALAAFKKLCLRQDLLFVVDKDFGQLEVLRELFPSAVVLLCVFHAIKFIKTLIATCPVVVETKSNLLLQFRRVLYSHTEDIFKLEDQKFVEMCGNLQVKTGENYVSFAEYYIRNWRSCSGMWVKFYRKNLPTLGDNTSNRVERMFWTLKQSIQDTFATLPQTAKAALHLIKFCDQKLDEKYAFVTNKRLIIHDSDKSITKLNETASKHLNDRGCTIFHHAQKRLETKVNSLEKVDNGVKEKFTEGSTIYRTSETTCNCTFAMTQQAPCAHVLFLRTISDEDGEVFSLDLFHSRYHRPSAGTYTTPQEILGEPSSPNEEDVSAAGDAITGDDFSGGLEEEEDLVLSDRKKHSIVMPVLMRIGNLIASHPTKKFLDYLDALNELEKRIRRGQNFMMQLQNILSKVMNDDDDSEEEDEVAIGHDDMEDDSEDDSEVGMQNFEVEESSGADINGNTVEYLNDEVWEGPTPEDDNQAHDDTQDTVRQDDTSQEEEIELEPESVAVCSKKRKFGGMVFKEGLTTKGRPKKRTKQFCFNKTSADKKAAKVRKTSSKGKKKTTLEGKKKDFIDDDSFEDEEEKEAEEISDFELKLCDDDSDDDLEQTYDDEVSFKCSICDQMISNEYSAPSCSVCKNVFHQNCHDDYGCIKC